MSSIKLCENHNGRKRKDSYARFIRIGLVGPKYIPNWYNTMGIKLIFLNNTIEFLNLKYVLYIKININVISIMMKNAVLK